MTILVIDVGTSSIRASIVRPDSSVVHESRRPMPPDAPFPGLLQFDPEAMARSALDAAAETLAAAQAAGERPAAVGVTTQRASALAWDATDGRPVGPGLGWQDLRTVGACLELQAKGFRFAPNESATKYGWLADQAREAGAAGANLRLGTVDSWMAWTLTGGGRHVTDASNAGVTGLLQPETGTWRSDALQALNLDPMWLPEIIDSSGELAETTTLGLPLLSLVGDQQASLVGQGCTRPGLAKATFGTGGMLDICLGDRPPAAAQRSAQGCFPIIAWRLGGRDVWGSEAIMLAAGSAVDWMVQDIQILSSPAESEEVAAGCDDAEGVVFVPALLGQGTPQWDFGARGALFGLTGGSKRSHIVRAVLEGVAHTGADLLEATEADTGLVVESLRVDGGMSANSVFVQALADATGRPIEVSRQLEATTLGAGYLAGMAAGTWSGPEEVAERWAPRAVVEPSGRDARRDRWKEASSRASAWYPELSAIHF